MYPVVILAGGLATRLGTLTETIPKSLIMINERPFIAWQLELLKSQGIQRVVLCLGHFGEMIEDYVKNNNNFGLDVAYSYDGAKLLGTGGAIKKALSLLDENFFVIYGDSYLTCDFKAVQSAYEQKNKLAMMTVLKNDNQWDASNIEFKDDRLINYDKMQASEKMQHIDYGLGVLSWAAFDDFPRNQKYDLAKVYQDLLKNDKLGAFEVKERFYEIGSERGIQDF